MIELEDDLHWKAFQWHTRMRAMYFRGFRIADSAEARRANFDKPAEAGA